MNSKNKNSSLVGMLMVQRYKNEKQEYDYRYQGEIVDFDGTFYICDIFSFLFGDVIYKKAFTKEYFIENDILLFKTNEAFKEFCDINIWKNK